LIHFYKREKRTDNQLLTMSPKSDKGPKSLGVRGSGAASGSSGSLFRLNPKNHTVALAQRLKQWVRRDRIQSSWQ